MVDGRCCNDGTGAMGWNAAAAVTIVPRWHMPMILDALMVVVALTCGKLLLR